MTRSKIIFWPRLLRRKERKPRHDWPPLRHYLQYLSRSGARPRALQPGAVRAVTGGYCALVRNDLHWGRRTDSRQRWLERDLAFWDRHCNPHWHWTGFERDRKEDALHHFVAAG